MTARTSVASALVHAGPGCSPTAEGDLALPATVAEELAWTQGCDAVRTLRARLPRGRPASARAVAVLVAATAGK